MNNEKQNRPFGLWDSPITPLRMAQRTRLEDVQFTADGSGLVWLESRGRQGALVFLAKGDARRDLLFEHSARGGVGYGGGEFAAAPGVVYFANQGKALMRCVLSTGEVSAITPTWGAFGAPTPSPDGKWVVFVHEYGDQSALAIADGGGGEWMQRLARGADFYMQPAWSPAGDRLAWVEWDFPNMPWDATRLVLASLAGDPPRVVESRVLAGADGQGTYTQPLFSPDGRWLSYLAARDEWDDLVLVDLRSSAQRVLVRGEGCHLSTPAWLQGQRSAAWLPDSRHILVIRNAAGVASLWQVDIESGEQRQIPTGGYTWLRQLSVSPVDGSAALLASSPRQAERVLCQDGSDWRALAYTDAWMMPQEWFSQPEAVEWKTPEGSAVHGLFFPPRSPRCESAGKPPLLVHVHGGPTSQVAFDFPREAHFFTSRGYAWLEVNHRGSSGYGRAYQQTLHSGWGEVDVLDTVSGARHLARQGWVDGERMAVMGGSAGGFTVLNCLIRHPGVFKAGIALYPVADLAGLARETHRFERHYTDHLVAPFPQQAGLYRARSPLYQAGQIRDALAIFHGSEDKAVPVVQSEAMAAQLRKSGAPHLLQVYPGEGHGFRAPEVIEDLYRQIERFLQDHVLFG